MPRIKTIEDAAELCSKLARFYQRRLNRALGVGARVKTKSTPEERAVRIIVCRAKRDCASTIARRIRRGAVKR